MKVVNGVTFFVELVENYDLSVIKERFGNLYEIFLQNRFITVNNQSVTFSYVGIASSAQEVFCILPKYTFKQIENDNSFLLHARNLVKILKQYSAQLKIGNTDPEFYNNSFASEFNEIAIADILLNDFIRNGLWNLQNKYIVPDSSNEILWDYTIENTIPIISGRPYYFDFFSEANETIYSTLITRIHQWAVQYSINRYSDILDIDIDFESVELITFDELGDVNYLIAVLNKELQTAFNDRNIMLLKCLIQLIEISGYESDEQFSLFGKNKFEHVWESAVSNLFRNEYDKFLKTIAKPVWESYGSEIQIEKSTIRPDVLRWVQYDNRSVLLIIDAKYYLLKYNKSDNRLDNNPGVEDLIKQYFYEFILRRSGSGAVWLANSNTLYCNLLVYPGYNEGDDLFSMAGTVKIENSVTKNHLTNIFIHPDKIFKYYVENITLTPDELKWLISTVNSGIS